MKQVDEFELTIDPERFRSTNEMWNKLRLNDPWSVGYVSKLIDKHQWANKEEWEEYYYESGELRDEMLHNKPEWRPFSGVSMLDHPGVMEKLDPQLKLLNYELGRTEADLLGKGEYLYQMMRFRGSDITLQECQESVRFRVICETWNGIVVREHKAVQYLQNMWPNWTLKKVVGEMDHNFAVDYEVYDGDQLKFGLQVKPVSYKISNKPYLESARSANHKKNQVYTDTFGVPVHYAYVNGDQVLFELSTYVHK